MSWYRHNWSYVGPVIIAGLAVDRPLAANQSG